MELDNKADEIIRNFRMFVRCTNEQILEETRDLPASEVMERFYEAAGLVPWLRQCALDAAPPLKDVTGVGEAE